MFDPILGLYQFTGSLLAVCLLVFAAGIWLGTRMGHAKTRSLFVEELNRLYALLYGFEGPHSAETVREQAVGKEQTT